MKGVHSEYKFLEVIATYQYWEKITLIYWGFYLLLAAMVFFIQLVLFREIWNPTFGKSFVSSAKKTWKSKEKGRQRKGNRKGSGSSGENPDDEKKTWWQRHWKKVLAGTALSLILGLTYLYYEYPNEFNNFTGKNEKDYRELTKKFIGASSDSYDGVFSTSSNLHWKDYTHFVPSNFRVISTQTQYLLDFVNGAYQYPCSAYEASIGFANGSVPGRDGPGLLIFPQQLNYAWVNHFLVNMELEMLSIQARATSLGLQDLTLLQNYHIYQYLDNIHSTVMSGSSYAEREQLLLGFFNTPPKYLEFQDVSNFTRKRVNCFPSYNNLIFCWIDEVYNHLVKIGAVEDLRLHHDAKGAKLEIILSQESGVKLEIGK